MISFLSAQNWCFTLKIYNTKKVKVYRFKHLIDRVVFKQGPPIVVKFAERTNLLFNRYQFPRNSTFNSCILSNSAEIMKPLR